MGPTVKHIVICLQLILIMCNDVVLAKDKSMLQSFLSNIIMHKKICQALGYIKSPCKEGYVNNSKRLVNLAFGNKVEQSTYLDRKAYPESNAVNGKMDDFAHTGSEKKPWLRVDLGKQHHVYEIEVYNRKTFGNRFHDAEFTVGRTKNTNVTCGHFSGPGSNGERIIVRCPKVITARFVKIQIMKSGTYLNIAEVRVWGTKI